MSNQQGANLMEIMIGLLLSSLIMTALMNHYISTKRHYSHLQSSLDEAMELQIALDFMRDAIRQAGFSPCMNINQLTLLDHHEGYENMQALEATSELQINRMSPYFNVVEDMLTPNRLAVTHEITLRPTQWVMIADCYHAEILRIRNVSQTATTQTVTLSSPLTFTYQPPAYIGEWLHERFFVQSKGGLFYQREHTDELTPLVKSMSVKFDNPLVELNLGLDEQKNLTFVTRVRAP